MTYPSPASRGHRKVPHTADLTIEAWAPSRARCFEEAVTALVDAFVEIGGDRGTESWPIEIDPADDDELLVSLLEDVVFLLDAQGVVPVSTSVTEPRRGGLGGRFAVTSVDGLEVVGAVPKAVSRHGLRFAREKTGWQCRFTVDV